MPIKARIPQASRFRIARVVQRTYLNFGLLGPEYWLEPQVVFEPPFQTLGRIDAGLLVVDGHAVRQTTLSFRGAARCPEAGEPPSD